ncbi:MAG: hypothetical protein EXR65_02405 [Dehalococcoidia bacterium]|nr:hypothetical protein [Dehalococcoidia bacterium]
MSLLARVLARLAGRSGEPAARPPQSGEEPRRRRGRRGGRGRSGGSGQASTNGAAPQAPAARGQAERLRDDDRSRGRQRYSGPIPRDQLDAPLPEDIAFRPASEGGDDSILGGRRRKPPGLRATKRVLLGGSRSVTGFPAPGAAQPEAEWRGAQPGAGVPRAEPGAGANGRPGDGGAPEPDATAGGEKRRRRGRRGGRGRRRGGSGGASSGTAGE